MIMKANHDEGNRAAPYENDETETQPQMLSATRGGLSPLVSRPKTITKFTNKEVFKVTANSSTWITGDVPSVSYEYRRPRTAFEVNDADVVTIAQRIFNCNKIRSIHSVYDGAISNCKTTSYMKFTIRLLRLSDSTNTILVDVRRRAGCSITFRDEYQAIFCAAVYGTITPPCSMRISLANLKCMNINYILLEEGSIERSLKKSMIHLTSRMCDTRVLTLQDLLSTTNTSSIDTSTVASKLIVTEYQMIFEYILDDIVKQVDYGDDPNGDDDSEEYLRSLALNIFGNVLSSVLANKALLSLIHQKYCTVSIIQSLVWYVSKAQTCPWNSCLAAKCLRLLASTSSEVINQIGTKEYMALYNAEKIGQCSYELLKNEAKNTLIVTAYDHIHR